MKTAIQERIEEAKKIQEILLCEFFVPGQPIPLPRPSRLQKSRRLAISGKHPVHGYQQSVMHICRNNCKEKLPLDSLLFSIDLLFVIDRPQYLTWVQKEMTSVPGSGLSDLDNFVKAVLDSLNGNFWVDDKRVAKINAIKVYRSGTESIGTYGRIFEIVKDS